MHSRTANMWYRQGQQELRAGDTTAAIESFRKATTNDHDNQDYSLALGRALARQGNAVEATKTLSQIRERAPENGEVNLELARLAAKAGEVQDARRYYNYALYAVWPPEEMDRRRRDVRKELIEFLLDHNESTTALAELLIFTPDIPDTAKDHVQAGGWFLKVGDAMRAREQFTLALKLEKNNVEALDGAGEAEFQLGNYAQVVRYLEPAAAKGSPSPTRDHLLAVSKSVLADDPMASRLSTSERLARLRRLLGPARERLAECLKGTPAAEGASGPVLSPLEMAAASLESNLTPRKVNGDPDLIRQGLQLTYRIEDAAAQACGGSSGDSLEVLKLLAKIHSLENDQA